MDFPSTIFTANHIYHVAVLVDGVNKVLKARVWDVTASTVTNYNFSPTDTLALSTGEFSIGGDPTSGEQINGNDDEFVVFNRLLADAEIDEIRDGTFGPIPVSGTGTAISLPSVAAADGYAQVSGSAAIARPAAIATGVGAHGIAGAAAVTRTPVTSVSVGYIIPSGAGQATGMVAVAVADGYFGFRGTAEITRPPAVMAAIGAHGVSGVAVAADAVGAASALGVHGVGGHGQAVEANEQAMGVGARGVSGQGVAACLPSIATADGYGLVSGTANLISSPARMTAYVTYIDPLRSRAKRFFESLPVSNLRNMALKWIKDEINKAA